MLHLGNREVSMDNLLGKIKDSHPGEETEVLQARLEEDGYLCMRGLIPRDSVLAARRVLYDRMAADQKLTEESTFDYPRGSGESYMGRQEVTHQADFLGAVEHPDCFAFFNRLFGEPSLTFNYKWARAVPEHAAGTQAHMDVVYMGRGSERLHTMWVPVGDVASDNGPMVILDRSHNHPALQPIRDTYGKMDVDRDLVKGGWFTNDYQELSDLTGTRWLLGDYQAGDVIIMGTHLFHGSLRNERPQVRFTCDVRFQPAADPVDERWGGKTPIGHCDLLRGIEEDRAIEMEQARRNWNI